MITQDTIQRIFETARVEEVVGEFVNLKKRGVNMIGLCPFHNEKTPSFTVSPTKGIYKCFGCGESGNSVKFLMEHEHYSYPEALKYLAGRYNIEIEETQQTAEEKEKKDLSESLYIINEFAQQFFSKTLFETEEGKSIGLSYFKERGFREATIKKFQLGYSPNEKDAFTQKAISSHFNIELLKKLGLTGSSGIDFFRERVIFPIHNLTGKVIAFGGRTLKTDKKIPKYINSPESDIYNKSKVLFGIYQAKTAIRAKDICILAEGYTDVVSLHQAGIENIVASSGTSLTVEQIRLIKRFTNNIHILYDGDQAGIKAASRGIELVLKEGLNVKIILIPDNEDPDSYLKKVGHEAFTEFLNQQAKDFILFKTGLMMQAVQNDPVKKSELTNEIVETISNIPDPIIRSQYIRECSAILSVDESILVNISNKLKRKALQKETTATKSETDDLESTTNIPAEHLQEPLLDFTDYQEKDVVRLLVLYGDREISEGLTVTEYILSELEHISFENKLYQKIHSLYKGALEKNHKLIPTSELMSYPDEEVSSFIIDLLTSPYSLSENWDKMHDIVVPDLTTNFKKDIISGLAHFKLKKLDKLLEENSKKLKTNLAEAEYIAILKVHQKLIDMKKQLVSITGTVVSK